MKYGFIKVAAVTPKTCVADTAYNAKAIAEAIRNAAAAGARIVVTPELGLTAYTCSDLFLQDTLLDGAERGLAAVLEACAALDVLYAVGCPVRVGGKLYNCAAVAHGGPLLGLVPKTLLPNYGEFY